MTDTQDPNAWMTAWLDTQRQWLNQWQTAASAATSPQSTSFNANAFQTNPFAGMNPGMHAGMGSGMGAGTNPFQAPPAAQDVMQQFQTLMQNSMQSTLQAMGVQPEPKPDPSKEFWQRLQQVFPLGYAREEQLAWQQYAEAVEHYRQRMQGLIERFAQVFNQALEAVQAEVTARAARGEAALGVRELHDLWVEQGERLFASLAHDSAFSAAQAECGNALNRVKQSQQVILEHWLKSVDLPTRSELNTVHQRLRDMARHIAELEAQLAAGRK